jgi:SPP1 family predicted phage head-tail adaptor
MSLFTTAIAAGELRHRIVIQDRSLAQDSFGGQLSVWTDRITARAAVKPLTGRELELAQAVATETSHQVSLRYRPGITPAQRLLYAGRIFNIHAVIDVDERHVKLVLLVSEGLNDG